MGKLPFDVITSPVHMRAIAENQRRDGRRIAVVPTMGYLHQGHLSLLREGRSRADCLILTLFVNPTQFGPNEDLEQYPRDHPGDLAKARDCGVDLVYMPDVGAMYGPHYQTYVQVRQLQQPLCGANRPGHFDGVTSVVTKLFHATQPHVAIFGQKDYQQLALIRRMVEDLDFGIEVVGMPIVREPDGLAMSSRNAYLSDSDRAEASCLARGLAAARACYDAGERTASTMLTAARAALAAAPSAQLEYLELRDAVTLEPVEQVNSPVVIAIAVSFGRTRLIDNTLLG